VRDLHFLTAMLLLAAGPVCAQSGMTQSGMTQAGMTQGPTPALSAGLEIRLPPGAVETARKTEDPARFALPTGAYTSTARPARRLDGRLTTTAYRIPPERGDTLVLAQAIRDQLLAQGYEIALDCATRGCGGFDFRFNYEVLPPPVMEVSLADFRLLSAQRSSGGVAVLISQSPRGGFVQVSELVSAPAAPIADLVPPAPLGVPVEAGPLAARLLRDGRAVLEAIDFQSGQTTLDADGVSALGALAAYLRAAPEIRVLIVGHTDSTGGLAANIALSRQRARAVRDALVRDHGIAAERITAEGAGYLAPRASNRTPAGRDRNRRVEVVLP